MSRLSTYIVLSFNLDDEDLFIDQQCFRVDRLIEAVHLGVHELGLRTGVVIVREETISAKAASSLEVIALCGSAHDECVALYVLGDLKAGLWPEPQEVRQASVKHRTRL